MDLKLLLKPFRPFFLIDTIMVLLVISLTYSTHPYLFLTSSDLYNHYIVSFFVLLYIVFRFYPNIYFPKKDVLFYLYCAVFIANIISCLVSGAVIVNTAVKGYPAYFLANVLTYILLYNVYVYNRKCNSFIESFNNTIRGYFLLCYIALFCTFLMLLMVELFHFNPMSNDVTNTYDIFMAGLGTSRTANETFYYPYYMSVVSVGNEDRIDLFHSTGSIYGIFHEPHIMTFMVFPALIIFLYQAKSLYQKGAILLVSLLYMLCASSAMNILSILLLIVLYLGFRKPILSIVIFILALNGFLLLLSLENPLSEFILSKLISGSADYGIDALIYTFTPKSFWGNMSMLDTSQFLSRSVDTMDVGFLIFFLNICFLVVFVYKLFKISMSQDYTIKFVALSILYYFLHSFKLTMKNYEYTYLMLMIFMLDIAYKYSLKTRKNSR